MKEIIITSTISTILSCILTSLFSICKGRTVKISKIIRKTPRKKYYMKMRNLSLMKNAYDITVSILAHYNNELFLFRTKERPILKARDEWQFKLELSYENKTGNNASFQKLSFDQLLKDMNVIFEVVLSTSDSQGIKRQRTVIKYNHQQLENSLKEIA